MIQTGKQFAAPATTEKSERVTISLANTDKVKVVSLDGNSTSYTDLDTAMRELRAFLGVPEPTKQRNDERSDKGIILACIGDQLAQVRDAIATKKQMSAAVPPTPAASKPSPVTSGPVPVVG